MKLVEPFLIEESQFQEFIQEFEEREEALVPYSIDRKQRKFGDYLKALEKESRGENLPQGWVPASTFFLVDDEQQIVGAVNIRHQLNENLKLEGGHAGYGIRPGARKKGYGTKILALALEKLDAMGLQKVLITCDKGNVGSCRVIENNGGKLHSEVEKDGQMILRYWIER